VPCDTSNRFTIDFGKADPKAIEAAMAKLYPGVAYTLRAGELTSSRRIDLASVRKEMSRQTVMAQAKRFGWGVQEQKDGNLLLQKGRL
jgi:hypothetical protein